MRARARLYLPFIRSNYSSLPKALKQKGSSMAEAEQTDLATLTVQLLSAYVANNQLPSTELAELIKTTRTALSGEGTPETAAPVDYPAAVSVRKSLGSREHILSLIDGRPYKTLKRHLAHHGLSPADYRARYKLAKDYPMVAPAYSDKRRAVAQALGLGQRSTAKASVDQPEATVPPASEPITEAPATEPKTKAVRPSKPRQSKPATKPAPSSDSGDAGATGSAEIAVLTPKRSGGRSTRAAKTAENSADAATPTKRGPKPAQAAPVESPSLAAPSAKRKSVKTDIATGSSPPQKRGRKAKAD